MTPSSAAPGKAELAEIAAPVREEIDAFNAEFKRAMISDVPVVNLVAKYIIKTKGKQVRPMLVLLAAKACGLVNEATYRAATLVELLHTATLVHDDVIDESDERRGLPSIRALWKNKIGVLMGDYLLAQGLLRTVATGEYHFLEITSRAVRRMSEGELYQLQKARQLNATEADYFRIIADKTASLLSTCCELGAASVINTPLPLVGEPTNFSPLPLAGEPTTFSPLPLAGEPTTFSPLPLAGGAGGGEFRTAMRDYGEYVGIAFQIRDDLFAYDPSLGSIGKPATTDFKDKKLTLPLLHALSKSSAHEKKHILSLIKSGKAAERAYGEVVGFVESKGGVAYATAKAHEYAGRAVESIAMLAPSESKSSLEAFASFVVERVK